ncbi:MAG: hypothetical protein U0517_04565 [Candidatus Andersenbacteria bacterium]
MSQRARYILIIVILLVVIGAGGGLIYYFSRQAGQPVGTAAGFARDINGQQALLPPDIKGQYGFVNGASNGISWLTCDRPYDDQANYQKNYQDQISVTFTCTNSSNTAKQIEVDHLDLPLLVYNDPSNGCLDQGDISRFTTWPPDNSFNVMLPLTANHTFISDPAGASCPVDDDPNMPGPQDNEQFIQVRSTSKVTFAPGQQVQFVAPHIYDTCNYYQIDDVAIELDANGNRIPGNTVILLGTSVRAQGASATCPKPTQLGNLQVRMYEDVDKNNEYSTPTAGGTDIPFAGETVQITDASGQDVTSKCAQGNTTGGAGRIDCTQIAVGRYTVKVSNPDPIQYQGPLVDTTANPQPGEQHNATGSEQLTLTVVPGATPTGGQSDVITFYDFGYTKRGTPSSLGNLEVRIYEDVDKNKEYSTPTAGGTDNPFAGETVVVKNAAGEDITQKGLCSQGSTTGGAGRLDCWQIATGKYTVTTTNPDPTTYTGPLVDTTANPASGEQHNANGALTLTLTVVTGGVPKGVGNDIITFYDYGYTKKQQGPIAAGSVQPCVIDKSVKDASTSNEESPDDAKATVSSAGEQLDFTLAYNCKGESSATTVPTGTTILLTDAYDDTLTTPSDSTISDSGSHDTAQHTITWTLQAGDPLTGTVSFSSLIDSGLAAGSYTSTNVGTISRNGEVEDQDQTVTTIRVGAVANEPPPSGTTTGGTGTGTGTTTNNQPRTPQTGVGANVAILLLSLLVAGAITAFATLRLKPAARRQ